MVDSRPVAGGRAAVWLAQPESSFSAELSSRVGAASGALVRTQTTGTVAARTIFSATLPKRVFPPMFNRYGGRTNTYGAHVDNAVRYVPARGGLPPERVRTDISCTLFLADPADYDGGELVIDDTYGEQRVKLAAGDMVVYPGTSVHRVEPVTRGHRVASFFWVESMVRSDEQRRLLHDMDRHLMHLRGTVGETDVGVVGLTGTYHNLLRLWADT